MLGTTNIFGFLKIALMSYGAYKLIGAVRNFISGGRSLPTHEG